jgi:hypothetical protein
MQPRIDLNLGNNMPSMYPGPRAGMWTHLPPHQQLVAEQSEKQREYLKQQQKLRLMTAASTPVGILFLYSACISLRAKCLSEVEVKLFWDKCYTS